MKTNNKLSIGNIPENTTSASIYQTCVLYFVRNPRLTKPLHFLTLGGRKKEAKGRGGEFLQNTLVQMRVVDGG